MRLKCNPKCDYLDEITQIRDEIKTLENIFNNTTSEEVIDSCIYNIKALHTKHAYYIGKIKEKSSLEQKITVK